jgi:hypothetical protein
MFSLSLRALARAAPVIAAAAPVRAREQAMMRRAHVHPNAREMPGRRKIGIDRALAAHHVPGVERASPAGAAR